MRSLLEKLQKGFAQFIEQRDDLLMLAGCSDDDVAIALKVLRDLEQSTGTDVFLLFSDSFIQPGPFVSVAIERLKQEHRIASAALAEEGRPSFPPLPDPLFDERRPPAERLAEAVKFARSLVPRGGDHRLVWVMFPREIADRREYLKLVASFVPWQGVQPWMRGLRLIFRDLPATAQYAPGFAKAPRVRLHEVDAGPAAVESSLKQDVDNDELPVEERMHSLLALANLDYAHNRNDDAVAKYKLLLGHYQQTGNHLMQAFVLNAFGDIFHRAGDLEKARYWFECAVVPGAECKDPVILGTVGRNLADVAYKQGRYQEAEQYYDGVDKLAAHRLDPEGKITALEWRGLSAEKQGAYDRAIPSWEAAATLSRNIGLPGFLGQMLGHLSRGYRAVGMTDKAALAEAERQGIAQEVA